MLTSGTPKGTLVGTVIPEPEPGLEHYWQVIKRHWLTASTICFCTTAFVLSSGLKQVPTYEAQGKMRFKGQESDLPGLAGELSALRGSGGENSITTEIGILTATPIVRETIEELNLRSAEGQPIRPRAFLGNLSVTNDRSTNLITVTYRSPDPELATQAVNTLMEVYLEQQLESNRAEASAARRFIESELPAVESRAQAAEAELRKFKERNQIVAFEESVAATASSLAQLEQQLTALTSQLLDVNARFEILQSRIRQEDPQMALIATTLSQSPGIQAALQAYQQVELEIAQARAQYRDEHPTLRQLITKRNEIQQVLQARIDQEVGGLRLASTADLQMSSIETELIGQYIQLDAEQRGLAEQAGVLQRAQDIYRQRAQVLPQLEQEYRELQRRLDATQSTYKLLLQGLQEVRVTENRNVGNVRIIQPAEVLGGPITPGRRRYLLMGLGLGSLLGVAAAVLSDRLDRSIKTVEEAQQHFNLPVLGVIPRFGKPTKGLLAPRQPDKRSIPALVVDKSASLAREAYHLLRSNLQFLNSDVPPRLILLTSSLPQEGTSSVASNLALAMAQTGQRVLLIDADLHYPIQHWIWGQPNLQGLSNVLVGQTPIEAAITPVATNLDVLFAGVLPPNPAALFDSKRMATLLSKFKDQYDFVFVDTPSLSSGASASVLGKLVDGLLLVVRPGVATHQSASYAKTLLEQSRQTVLGLVVNGAIAHNEPYGQYLSEEFFEDRRDRAEHRHPEEPVSIGSAPLSPDWTKDPPDDGFWTSLSRRK